jgi:FG-GAP repeat
VASAGDINGDGYDDIIVGEKGQGKSTYSGGRYVLFGHAGGFAASLSVDALTGTNGFKIALVSVADGTGMVIPAQTNVSSAGDLNERVLYVRGDAADTLHLAASDGWSTPDTATISGYAVYASGEVKIVVETGMTVHSDLS